VMRTNIEENEQLGKLMAERINKSTAPVTVLLPLKGISMIDAPDQPFWWPEADQALFNSLKASLRQDIPVIEMDCNVNDPQFAEKCAQCLLEGMRK